MAEAGKIKIQLLETCLQDQYGSMFQYGNILNSALGTLGYQVTRTFLAPCGKFLQRFPKKIAPWIHHIHVLAKARRIARTVETDFFHITDGSYAYIAQWLPQSRTVITVHDIIPYLQSVEHFPSISKPSRPARFLIARSMQRLHKATRIMTDSHTTRSDLLKHTKVTDGSIDVVPLPVRDVSCSVYNANAYSSSPPFILHIGNNGFYKNRLGVIRIFSKIANFPTLRLRLAGPPPNSSHLALIDELGLQQRVDFETNPTNDRLDELYSTASLLLFPSIYEGYGWPPLEAMQVGCPVVSSDAGSLLEVVADAALVAPWTDEAALAKHCETILLNETIRRDLIVRGRQHSGQFNSERFAKDVGQVYRRFNRDD